MPFASYTVTIDEPEDGTPAGCGNCSWSGRARDAADIETAVLTPGDPAPVGRCPQCGSLAYVP